MASLGELLKHWRQRRGCSQLALALDTGVSQRHLSFVESGRSQPSRALLMRLADALDVPLRDRNPLWLAAGYAPAYADTPWDAQWNADEMRVIRRALERMLRLHAPFPAIVLDRGWNVLMTNDAAPQFFGSFVDLSRHAKPRNLLRLMLDPQGMRPFVHDWPSVARNLLARIRREAVGGIVDGSTQPFTSALATLCDTTDDPLAEPSDDPTARLPVVPIGFIKDGTVLNYFSMVSTVGTPQATVAQELRVECMFPADQATERWHLDTFGSP